MTKLLSVCIPSKNRHETLVHSIAAALELGDEVEVVVLDTSDDPLPREQLSRLPGIDSRFRYEYLNEQLSFVQTFDRVIELASGRYVTIIGDDDAILPGALNMVRRAEREGLDNVTPSLPAFYNWPNFQHRYYGASDAGLLAVRHFGGEERYPDARAELLRSAAAGFQNFDSLPRIYYGLVARRCLDELQSRAGGRFFGATPDISGAVGLATVVDRYLVIDAPLFLPGSSAKSGAGKSGMKRHVGDLRTTPQTSAFADTWPKAVPPIYSVQTVWAQAALSTLNALDAKEATEHLNVGLLHAQTLVHNIGHGTTVLRSLLANLACPPRKAASRLLAFSLGCIREVTKRARGLIFHVIGGGYYRYTHAERGIPDVHVAARRVTQLIGVEVEGDM